MQYSQNSSAISQNYTENITRSLLANSGVLVSNSTSTTSNATQNSTLTPSPIEISQIDNLTSINSAQLIGMRTNTSKAGIQTYSQSIFEPYGSVKQKGKLVASGNILNFAVYSQNSVTFYQVVVQKATPNISIGLFGTKIQEPGKINYVHVPVLNGEQYYSLPVSLASSLEQGNNATYTYSIKFQNGTKITNTITGKNVSMGMMYKVRSNQSVSITFDTSGDSNYTAVDPIAVVVPVNIVYYVPITFTNSQTTGISDPFQLNVTVNSLNYKQYEDPNLDNVEFFYINATPVPSWLEGNAQDDQQASNLYTSENTVYWLSVVGNFLPAGSSNTLYMGFAAPGNNLFDGVTVGAAPNLQCASNCPQTSYAQYDNGNDIFAAYFNGDTPTSSFTAYSGYTVSQATGITYGPTSVSVIKISGNGATKDSQAAYNIGVPNSGYVEEANWYSTTANNKEFLGLGDSLSLGSIQNAIGAYVASTSSYSVYISSGTEHHTSLSTTISENAWWYGSLDYPGSSATSFSISLGTNLYSSSQTISQNPLSSASTIYLTPLSVHTGTASITIYYNWLRLRSYPPSGVMPTASFASLINGTATFTESGLPNNGETWSDTYGGTSNSMIVPNSITFATNSLGSYAYSIPTVTSGGNTYAASPSSGSLVTGNSLAISFSILSSTCTILLNSQAINFGTLIPTASYAATNQIQITNSGNTNANILVSGTGWSSVTSNAFGVTNTIWSTSSGGSGTDLTGSLVDTLVVDTASGSNSLYFGVNVPATQNSDTYSQTITIENNC